VATWTLPKPSSPGNWSQTRLYPTVPSTFLAPKPIVFRCLGPGDLLDVAVSVKSDPVSAASRPSSAGHRPRVLAPCEAQASKGLCGWLCTRLVTESPLLPGSREPSTRGTHGQLWSKKAWDFVYATVFPLLLHLRTLARREWPGHQVQEA
jgi:hypothetical protein